MSEGEREGKEGQRRREIEREGGGERERERGGRERGRERERERGERGERKGGREINNVNVLYIKLQRKKCTSLKN